MQKHKVFGDVFYLIGLYYSTIGVYRNQPSNSVYIEESRHHDGSSLTNMMGTIYMKKMLDSLRAYKIYIGFSEDHHYRHDATIGGFWEYDMQTETFSFLGMENDDLLYNITKDILSL